MLPQQSNRLMAPSIMTPLHRRQQLILCRYKHRQLMSSSRQTRLERHLWPKFSLNRQTVKIITAIYHFRVVVVIKVNDTVITFTYVTFTYDTYVTRNKSDCYVACRKFVLKCKLCRTYCRLGRESLSNVVTTRPTKA